jgi:hypothetical protein
MKDIFKLLWICKFDVLIIWAGLFCLSSLSKSIYNTFNLFIFSGLLSIFMVFL